MSSRSRLLEACLVVGACALLAASYRVYTLERGELEHTTRAHTLRELMGAPNATRVSARLTSLQLRANDHAIFTLCARDGLAAHTWQGALDFAVLDLDAKKLMLRVPLDAAHLAHAKPAAEGACLMLGQGVLEHGGTYSIEAAWPKATPTGAVLEVPIYVRVTATSALGTIDRACLLLLGVAMLAALLGLFFGTQGTSETAATSAGHAWLGVLVALGLLYAATQLPMFGATLTLAKGVLLLVLQAGLAFLLARVLGAPGVDTRAQLGLVAPPRRGLALALAIGAWPLLVWAAELAFELVPATGEAPIESFVAWPSGMLSAALLGVFLPIGEELLFRGYVYGVLAPRGRALAAGVSLLAFVSLHAQQTWGQWGALVAVACAGAVFTALRVSTGSTVVPALTHVAYNLALSCASIFRA